MLSVCDVTALVILSLISVRCDTGTDDNSIVKFVQLNIQDSLSSLQKQLHYETSTRLQFDKDLTEMLRLYRAMSGEIERISKENIELKQDFISLLNTTANTDILSSQIQFLNKTMTSALVNITKIQTEKPADCKEILSSEPNSRSGVYTIYPDGTVGYSVYCDMTSQGGGWTVIQRRINGILEFDKTWKEYKDGFGDLNSEHWIGNDVIHRLAKRSRTLLVRVLGKESGSTWKYAMYSDLHVGDETSNYRLTFRQGSYSGNAGDGLNKDGYGDNNNMMFSTKDRDNDQWGVSCANHHKGGWWFKKCEYGCLNCKYLGSDSTWDAIQYKSTWMMIR